MIELKYITTKGALLMGAFFLMSSFGFGQSSILELLPGSERLEYDKKTGLHRLYGNVNFKYQGNIMYCDSAYYQEKKELVYAYGHVHINKRDTLNLFCDSLFYNGRTQLAKLWGNVRVRDNEFKLTTDTLDYNARKSEASYHHGGRVESIVSKEVLTSRIGYFYPESKNFYFSRNVDYQGTDIHMETDTLQYFYSQKKTYFHGPTTIQTNEETMYCEYGWYNTNSAEGSLQKNASISRPGEYISGDTLLYKPDQKLSIGMGHVYFIDSSENLSFRGDYAYNSDSLEYSFVTGKAIATKYLDDDTLHLHADTLYHFAADSINELKAYYGAKIFSTKFQGIADSVIYASKLNKVAYFGNPVIWTEHSEMKGDSIYMNISDSTISEVTVYQNASILMEVAVDSFYNQISGQTIVAYFKDNELHQAVANGNATTIYFPEETVEEDSIIKVKRVGMNRLYASNLRVDLDSGEVVGVSYMERPDGVMYPIDQLNEEEQFIKGFDWKAALRPRSLAELTEGN